MYHKPSLQSLKVQHNTVKVKFSWHTFSHFQQVKYNNFGYFPINVLLQALHLLHKRYIQLHTKQITQTLHATSVLQNKCFFSSCKACHC